MKDFDGSVYRRNDDGYEAARRGAVWNGLKPKRFPAVIAAAGSRDDVARAVALARDEGLSIGVRSGGHSWVGNAVRDGGMLLDLSRLKGIDIDPQTRTAAIEPGVVVHEFAAALSAHGLTFPFGHCPTVGLTGFILGGGFGFNWEELGPAAFALRAVDVVTAAGEVLHATDDDHADIMWAARGSGPGFFAAATRMHLDLSPAPGVVATAVQIHPFAAYDELVHWYVESGRPGLIIAGANPAFGQQDRVLMVLNYAFADDLDEAAQKLAVTETAPGLDRAILHQPAQPSSIEAICDVFDRMYPEGYRYLSDNVWIRDPSTPELWRDGRAVIESLPTPRSGVWLIPGSGPRSHPNAAFSLRTEMSFQIYGIYDHSAQDDAMFRWHRDAMATIEPYSIGAGYVGDSNLFAHPVAVLHPDNAARLEKLRGKYDPDGRFYGYPSELPPARL